MLEASEMLEFEKAASVRDQIQAIEKVQEGQKVLHLSSETLDLIALATDGDEAWMEVFFVRQGKLVGTRPLHHDRRTRRYAQRDTQRLRNGAAVLRGQPVRAAPHTGAGRAGGHRGFIEAWLGEKRRSKVRIYVPQRGREAASHVDGGGERLGGDGATGRPVQAAAEEGALGRAMEELQEALSLPTLPRLTHGVLRHLQYAGVESGG